MIAKNIFSDSVTPSIHQLSPIYNHKYSPHTYNEPIKYSNERSNFSQQKQKYSNEKRNLSTEKRRLSNDKYQSRLENENELNEKYGILSRNNNLEERNSLLLRSYDKYDHVSNGSRRDRIVEVQLNDSQNSPVFQTDLSSLEKPYFFEHRSPQFTQTKLLATSSQPSEYELLLEYELKRQKQRNQILQKRLNNKEDFIEEMKKIQSDLTIAYAKCQEDLNIANTVIYEMQTKGIKEIRDYKQEIEQLKHQVHVLQKEIQVKESKKPKPSSSKKSLSHLNSIDAGKDQPQDSKKYVKSKSSVNLTRHKSISEANLNNPPRPRKASNPMNYIYDFNDTKKQLIIEENRIDSKNTKQGRMVKESGMKRSHTQSVLSNTNKRQNSSENNKPLGMNKNIPNQPLNSQFSSVSHPFKQESNLLNTFKPMITNQISQFQTQIMSNLSKVANFLHHFIDMCQKMQEINQRREKEQTKENFKGKLIHELKKYWKWIKEVIREWKELKDQKILQKKGTKQFGGISNLSIKVQNEDHGYDTQNKQMQSKFSRVGPNPSPQKILGEKLNDDKNFKENESKQVDEQLIE